MEPTPPPTTPPTTAPDVVPQGLAAPVPGDLVADMSPQQAASQAFTLPLGGMTLDAASAAATTSLGLARVPTPISMNVLDLIVADHNRIRAMYDAYMAPAVTADQKQLLAWEMTMEMSAHAGKEELVLYPAVRSTMGEATADHLIAEHAAIKGLLAQLDTMTAADPSFDMAVRGAVQSILAHVAEEEANFLPRFAALVTPATLLHLGIQFEAAKVRAPTRPHPEVSNLPPFAETAMAAAKQVDTALDQARMPTVVPVAVFVNPALAQLGQAAMAAAAQQAAAEVTGGGPAAAAGGGDDMGMAAAAGAGGGSEAAGQQQQLGEQQGLQGMPGAAPLASASAAAGGDADAEKGAGGVSAGFAGAGGGSSSGRDNNLLLAQRLAEQGTLMLIMRIWQRMQ